MKESELERRLVNAVKAHSGLCYKWVSPGNTGVPDRIVILPGGKVLFVELKTETGRLSPIQRVQIARLEHAGANVAVVYCLEDVTEWIEEVTQR